MQLVYHYNMSEIKFLNNPSVHNKIMHIIRLIIDVSKLGGLHTGK